MVGGGSRLRQKAVALMYLLFIALVFIYIPSDFLDVMRNTDRSFSHSTDEIHELSIAKYAFYRERAGEGAGEYLPHRIRYERIAELTDSVYNRIDSLKMKIISEAGGFNKYGFPNRGRDYSSTEKIMIINGKAEILNRVLHNWKDSVKAIAGPSKYEMIDSLLEDSDTLINSSGREYSWNKYFFDKMPLNVAGLVLSKIQNEIRLIEYKILENIDGKKQGKQERVSESSERSREAGNPGDEMQGEVNLLDFKKVYELGEIIKIVPKVPSNINKDSIKITVTDQISKLTEKLKINKEGVVEYIPQKTGNYKFEVKYRKKSAESEVKVMNPEPVIQKMELPNLYVGINNELKFRHHEFKFSEVEARITKGEIIKKDGKFYARVSKPGLVEVTVFTRKNGKVINLDTRRFIAEELPEPRAYLASRKGGKISPKIMQLAGNIEIKSDAISLPDIYNIKGFSLYRIMRDQGMVFTSQDNPGAYFNENTREIINRAQRGDIYIFDNIRIEGADGELKTISAMVFEVI